MLNWHTDDPAQDLPPRHWGLGSPACGSASLENIHLPISHTDWILAASGSCQSSSCLLQLTQPIIPHSHGVLWNPCPGIPSERLQSDLTPCKVSALKSLWVNGVPKADKSSSSFPWVLTPTCDSRGLWKGRSSEQGEAAQLARAGGVPLPCCVTSPPWHPSAPVQQRGWEAGSPDTKLQLPSGS